MASRGAHGWAVPDIPDEAFEKRNQRLLGVSGPTCSSSPRGRSSRSSDEIVREAGTEVAEALEPAALKRAHECLSEESRPPGGHHRRSRAGRHHLLLATIRRSWPKRKISGDARLPRGRSISFAYERREYAFELTATYDDNQKRWFKRMIDEGKYFPTR